VRAGETVALVGRTGAGKSTFISLLPRFYDPTAGRITLGGIDLRDVAKNELRNRIAIVPQMPVLFNVSLAENIRLGRPGASDEDVQRAARRAHIHDFILSLPDGYNTLVGERGSSLSGGQRQRVAIARAFLKDAPILILDEATSALDSESEANIRQALGELVQGRTTFMIAHRFSSIRDASRILVFEQGRLTGDGPPREILQNHPIASKMAELQRSEET
jgi:subfamily B ATP-binding cassette protein MsbA